MRRAARITAVRLRLRAVLQAVCQTLPLPLVFAVGALTWIKIGDPSPGAQRWLLVGLLACAAVVVGAALLAALRRRPPAFGALQLDRHHGLQDRISSALAFSELPPAEQTDLMHAAIDDALSQAGALSPRKAAPLRVPAELSVVALLGAGLFAVSLLEVRTVRHLPPPATIDAMVMTADDLSLFREATRELEQQAQDPEALAAVRRFNQLIEDIAERRLDRREVFERLEQLQQDLELGAEADREALDEGLKNLAKQLEGSELTKPIAEPLSAKRLEDAEKAMRKLAERLRQPIDKPSKAELEKLRASLKAASEASSKKLAELKEQKRQAEQARRRLLKKKDEKGLSAADQRLLQKKERELERLEREIDKAERAKRQLSKLDRELAEAAQELMKQLNDSAKSLESGAEDINRMARKEMSDQEKRELLQKLKEMRELLRQQGKGGKERLEQLRRFSQRARGQQGDGKGQQGQGQGKGQGKDGKGPGKGGERLVLAPGGGGQSVPVPAQAPGAGAGQEGDQPGQGAGQGGQQYGSGHDPNLKGEASELQGSTKDVSAAAADTGEGSASSEVIYSAAQRGFVGRGYKQIFTDYQTVAEQVIEQDEIPSGYRFYVRRYFQLIRPRD